MSAVSCKFNVAKVTSTSSNMKLHINFVLFLLNVISVKCSFNIFPFCDYIDDAESVRIKCFGELYAGHSRCLEDLSNVDSNEMNRSRVKHLRIVYASMCENKETAALDGFFWNIRILDYSHGNSPTLHTNLKFRYLEVFNASHNELGFLSPSYFDGQLNLRDIDFSYNYILVIYDGTFYQNANLSVINLSHNSLQTVDRNTFSTLTKLKILDLSFNRIVSIDENAFQNNNKLETLKLQMNLLTRFDCHLFLPMRNLTSFDVSMESIEELDVSCTESSLNLTSNDDGQFVGRLSITTNEFHLSKEHLKELRHLNIAGKELKNVTKTLSLLSSELESLDLSSNHLGQIKANMFGNFTNLRHLKLSNTNLKVADMNPFFNQTKLRVLDISGNNLISMNFSLLSKTLEHVIDFNVANCHIQNIPEILKWLSSSLESLDLSYNRLDGIDHNTFRRFTNLRSLNLSHTNLHSYGFSTFFHQNKLKTLDISNNNWSEVNFSLFTRKFNDLETLNLENNRLHTIKGLTTSIFPNLNILGISKNRFTCEFLAAFLSNWPKLHLIYNPTKDTHIDGIDCSLSAENLI